MRGCAKPSEGFEVVFDPSGSEGTVECLCSKSDG
jgi:hypothetical protein